MQHSFKTYRESGKTGQDGGEAYVPLSPNSYRARGVRRKEGRKYLRNSVTLSFILIQFSITNLETLAAICRALKLT